MLTRVCTVVIAVLAVAGSPAHASVTMNTDSRLKIYSNDGDGMGYVVSGGVKKSIEYEEVLKYPLDSKGELRYEVVDTKNRRVKSPPGNAGQVLSRPLTDLELTQAYQAFIQISQAVAAASVAMDSNADPGAQLDAFDALRDNRACRVVFYEKAIDFCGDRIGRAGAINWTMKDNRACYNYGWGLVQCGGDINYNIGVQTPEGRKVVPIVFRNKGVSDRFWQVFSSWSGTIPQRI